MMDRKGQGDGRPVIQKQTKGIKARGEKDREGK